jgi:hypothetical protein
MGNDDEGNDPEGEEKGGMDGMGKPVLLLDVR